MTNHPGARAQILVVDDEAGARDGLVELLRDDGFAARGAADAFKALGQLEDWRPDLVITDVHMPGMDGIALMQKLRERLGSVGVIVMTAHSTVERAVEAMRLGADDYVTKPLRFDELLVVMNRVLAHRQALRELDQLREAVETDGDRAGWIGRSKASREIVELIRHVASSSASALLIGESGTGKELAARTLHRWSIRKDAPFAIVRCGWLEEAAVQRALFADDGCVAQARGGTVLLDDVDRLPLAMQGRLLSEVLDREPNEVRVIAATERDLYSEVRDKRFIEDLFYRLEVITLRLPTLQERREDIPLLAMHFLRRHAARYGKQLRGFSERAMEAMRAFDWPGNVRQLETFVEQAVVLCDGYEIEPRHLAREVMTKQRDPHEPPPIPGASLAELERYAILRTLEAVGGSTSRAAKILKISPRTIQYRMNEYRSTTTSGAATPPAHSGTR